MTKPITKEDLEEIKRRAEIGFVATADEALVLVATIYQNRDAMRAALDFVDGNKTKPDKNLVRAILRESLGLKEQEGI
jgi:hypothetical protein